MKVRPQIPGNSIPGTATFFLKDCFNVDHFKNVYCICYSSASVLCFGVTWDLSSTRDGTRTDRIRRRSLNHWTLRKVPHVLLILPNCTQRELFMIVTKISPKTFPCLFLATWAFIRNLLCNSYDYSLVLYVVCFLGEHCPTELW